MWDACYHRYGWTDLRHRYFETWNIDFLSGYNEWNRGRKTTSTWAWFDSLHLVDSSLNNDSFCFCSGLSYIVKQKKNFTYITKV